MSYQKPDMDAAGAQAVLEKHWGCKGFEVKTVSGGNLSRVFFFDHEGQGYVIRFSDMPDAFSKESRISELLASQGIPYPRFIGLGKAGALTYSISERIDGSVLADIPEHQRAEVLPDLVQVITRMNQVKLGAAGGYGWITSSGHGAYESWEQFLVAFYGEEQSGSFWVGWYELFRTSFLEKDVFEECYARMMQYAPYNAPHRHFVHNDCHAWNILTDGVKVTGLIDGNCLYGDFLIDISIAEGTVPGGGVVPKFREHYEKLGISIPHFEERMLGARYYKGLDGLRFYAKMGRKASYDKLRDYLLSLA